MGSNGFVCVPFFGLALHKRVLPKDFCHSEGAERFEESHVFVEGFGSWHAWQRQGMFRLRAKALRSLSEFCYAKRLRRRTSLRFSNDKIGFATFKIPVDLWEMV